MKKLVSLLALGALVSACTTVNPYTGQTQTAKSTWGTAIGAGAGALIGSTQSSKGALIGAAAGAAVGQADHHGVGAVLGLALGHGGLDGLVPISLGTTFKAYIVRVFQ